MNEVVRIRDQFSRAFEGEAWHGPALFELLKDVMALKAMAKPLARAHSIWEIVLHITAWHKAVQKRLEGKIVELSGEEDWPPVNATGENEWKEAVKSLEKSYRDLKQTVSSLSDSRLENKVAGKDYSLYAMLHGVIQHDLYHAGQIALLKKHFNT